MMNMLGILSLTISRPPFSPPPYPPPVLFSILVILFIFCPFYSFSPPVSLSVSSSYPTSSFFNLPSVFLRTLPSFHPSLRCLCQGGFILGADIRIYSVFTTACTLWNVQRLNCTQVQITGCTAWIICKHGQSV
jgi:hypothetical protein